MDEKKSFYQPLAVGLLLLTGSLACSSSFAGSHYMPAGEKSLNLASNGTFIFNPRSHSWKAVSSSGKVIRSGRASGGKGYCPDIKRSCRTPVGSYSVSHKEGASCRSSRYPIGKGGSPMPYCMFFSKNYAVHGSYNVPNHNASHGCIRVTPSDAKWLYQNFMHSGTSVIVKSY